MKTQLLTIAAISALTLSSCGGSEQEEVNDDAWLDAIEVSDDIEDDVQEELDMDIEDEGEVNSDETTASDEWKETLDGYESYVDDYIAIIKKQKADPTDMSIMTKYQELMQKGTTWTTKMSEMSSKFGPEQLSRMQEIQTKLSKAAL